MIVEFSILGVPKNWANYYVNKFVLYNEKKEWLETTTILGRVARVNSGCPPATKGHSLRAIQIHERRGRFLDKDGLYISAKPIVDGLKTELRRKVGKKFIKVSGAGLIWNDDPKHCDWTVTQDLCNGEEELTTIKIEIES